MTALDIGLPPYKKLSLLSKKCKDNPFRHGVDYYTRIDSEPKIDKSVFLYEMDFFNINQLQELKKTKECT